MEHAKHLIRAVLLILAAAAATVVFLQMMRPASFGALGHFRANAIQDAQAFPAVYGEVQECASCHKEQAETVSKAKHSVINCQMCHGPLSAHADKGQKIADMPIDRYASLCLRCHESLPARPESMKQINLAEHSKNQEIEDIHAEGVCLQCHTVHEPDI